MLCYSSSSLLLSEESSVDHACFLVVSDSESDSESSEDGEKFLTIWANDSLIGEDSGEGGKGDSLLMFIVTTFWTNGVGFLS